MFSITLGLNLLDFLHVKSWYSAFREQACGNLMLLDFAIAELVLEILKGLVSQVNFWSGSTLTLIGRSLA